MTPSPEIRRILLAVDFSTSSRSAARWGLRLLGPEVKATTVCVVEPPRLPDFLRVEDRGHQEIVRAATEEAEKALAELAEELGAPGLEVEVRIGKAAEELAAAAQELDADLVVVGPHGRRSGLRSFLGSTAEQLVRICPVPVLLVISPGEGPPASILAPVDASDLTDRVLGAALGLARRTGARLTALHAVPPRNFARMRLVSSRGNVRKAEEAALQRADEWLRSRLRDAGVGKDEADALTVMGEPAHEIVSGVARAGAGLVVMGSRGAGNQADFLLGGTARVVLANAPCPVLLITDSA